MAENIFKPNLSLRIYKARTADDSPVHTEDLSAAIIRHRYMDNLRDTATADYVYGFCSPMDFTNSEMAGEHDFHFAENIAVGFRISRKKVDRNTLRAALKVRIEEHVSTWNQTHPDKQIRADKLSKGTKASLVSACITALLPQTEWKEKVCGVFYLAEYGLLCISGATEKEADKIAVMLQQCSEDATRFDDTGVLDCAALLGAVEEADLDAALDSASEDNLGYAETVAAGIRHIWFLAETMTASIPSDFPGDSSTYAFRTVDRSTLFNVSMTEDTVICGEMRDGKITGPTVCSKNSDHTPTRYAMWKQDMDCISATFGMSGNAGSHYPALVLSAQKLAVIGLKGIGVKVRDSMVNDEEMLEATVILYLDKVSSALNMLAALLGVFILARASKERWQDTRLAERVWLEAYVPPCEAALETLPPDVTLK